MKSEDMTSATGEVYRTPRQEVTDMEQW